MRERPFWLWAIGSYVISIITVIVGALGFGPPTGPSMGLLAVSFALSTAWLLILIRGFFVFGWSGLLMVFGLPGAILWPMLLMMLHFEMVP
jgi:hypothetical protein